MKFKKKPEFIDAHVFDGTFTCVEQIKALFPELRIVSISYHIERNVVNNWSISVDKGGHLPVNKNDWIIKDSEGKFYPCNPDVFVRNYELYNTETD